MKQSFRVATLAVISILGAAADVSAQSYFTDRGAVLIGGSASFSSTGLDVENELVPEPERATNLILTPSVQYFVTPGLALGASVVFRYTSDADTSTRVFSLGPVISYFFGGPDSLYYPFVSGFAGISTFKTDGVDEVDTAFYYSASGGVAFALARNVALTGEVFYQGNRYNDAETILGSTSFGVRFGLLASIY